MSSSVPFSSGIVAASASTASPPYGPSWFAACEICSPLITCFYRPVLARRLRAAVYARTHVLKRQRLVATPMGSCGRAKHVLVQLQYPLTYGHGRKREYKLSATTTPRWGPDRGPRALAVGTFTTSVPLMGTRHGFGLQFGRGFAAVGAAVVWVRRWHGGGGIWFQRVGAYATTAVAVAGPPCTAEAVADEGGGGERRGKPWR